MSVFGDLQAEVISHQFSPTQYNDYVEDRLNEGYRYMAAQTDFPELTVGLLDPLVAGEKRYTAPADTDRLNTVALYELPTTTNTPLVRVPMDVFEMYDKTNTGIPTHYTSNGLYVDLWPVPVATSDYFLSWNYQKVPATVSADVGAPAPDLPEKYYYLLVHYALKGCYERENDYNSAQYHWGQFQEGVMKMRGEVHHQANDRAQPRIVGEDQAKRLLIEGF